MQLAKWISLISIWALAGGQDEFPNPDIQNYQYHYYVKDENTGDVKSHEEKKIGDTVTGQYTVGEPTGDLRVVTYTADDGGFRANVKYEEGGSPLSAIVDKERQTNPQSGYEFQWLPGSPDSVAPEKTEEGDKESKTNPEEITTEGKTETEVTSETSSQPEVSTQGPTSTVSDSTTTGIGSGSTPAEEKKTDDKTGPSIGVPADTNGGNGGSGEAKEPSAEQPSSEKDNSEDKSNSEKESGSKGSGETAESAEAAESAPESQEVAATEPGQMYLPVLPMHNAPFYTPESQARDDRPTIIYASQNFYNPWQWFGVTNKVEKEDKPASTGQPGGQYMTGLGYIIVPES